MKTRLGLDYLIFYYKNTNSVTCFYGNILSRHDDLLKLTLLWKSKCE